MGDGWGTDGGGGVVGEMSGEMGDGMYGGINYNPRYWVVVRWRASARRGRPPKCSQLRKKILRGRPPLVVVFAEIGLGGVPPLLLFFC